MKFLTEKELRATVRSLLAGSSKLNAAVAFWGRGACEQLGLTEHADKVKIVCNLKMGGTNPDEINNIRKTIEVLHRDDLHAKVYLFDNAVIIGSSNASANGLSYQDNDNRSWSEANVLIDDSKFVTEVSRWFKEIADSAHEVTPNDIKKARERWQNRRQTNIVSGKDLLTAAKSNPEQFSDHQIQICITPGVMSPAAEKTLEEARSEYLDVEGQVSCYEDWDDMPKNTILVDFSVQKNPKGRSAKVTYEGIWKTPEELLPKRVIGAENFIQLCFARNKVLDLGIGDTKKWCEAVRKATESRDFDWKNGTNIPLAKFSKTYLQKA